MVCSCLLCTVEIETCVKNGRSLHLAVREGFKYENKLDMVIDQLLNSVIARYRDCQCLSDQSFASFWITRLVSFVAVTGL